MAGDVDQPEASDAATATRPRPTTDSPSVFALLTNLRERTHGRVLAPDDADYEDARSVWNGMIDRRPSAIVQIVGNEDVLAALEFAREHDLPVAVRGGGHSAAGTAVCDDGLVIDLSPLKAIEVDTSARVVRADGGVTIGELDAATQAHGLAVPMGVVTETGIAGLTLSGGVGWLRRRYGLSADNLISAEVVTADGRVVVTNETNHPDLYWALRGGGGNFGIVTSFTYRAYPVGPAVAFTMAVHDEDGTPGALEAFHEWNALAPDEISAIAVVCRIPELEGVPSHHHGQPGLLVLGMHAGTPDEGEAAMRPLRELGTPVADLSHVGSYLDIQQFFDEDYPAHLLRYYWKSLYLADLPAGARDMIIASTAAAPSPLSTVDVWPLGGATGRVAAEASAFGDRSAPYLIGIEANWEETSADPENIAWARELHAALEPYATGGQYLNFPGLHEDSERILRATFGANYDRLVDIKTTYDPTNLFRHNANIPPRAVTARP